MATPAPTAPGTPTSNTCAECKESIGTHQFIRVGKFCFHSDHFICSECKKDLRNQKFHRKEPEGKFYCAQDYMDKFSHTCQHCRQKIAPSVSFLQVLGGYYHPEHFVCFTCEKPFPGGKYFPKENRPYCEEHFKLLNAPKCAHCEQPVVELGKVSIGGKIYHGKCVFCSHCSTPLSGPGQEMLKKDDKIYCREHFNDFVCRTCTGCGKHIYDQCIAVNNEFYHPDCLRCSVVTCMKKMERYTCVSGYLRCPEHEEADCALIPCSVCKKDIYGEVVRTCGLRVHETCFKCGYCDSKLDKVTCKFKKDRLCCDKCIYNKEFVPYKRDETQTDFVPDDTVQIDKKLGPDEVPADPLTTSKGGKGDGDEEDVDVDFGLDDEEGFDDEEDPIEDKDKKQEPIAYRKGDLIGVGAFGKVYEAMNTKTGELIAVKQVVLEDTNSDTAQELQNEIQLMRRLRHRNIVALLGTERVGTTLSIIMEYVPGKSLDSILTRYGALQEDVTCNYTKQILLALEYCHKKKIVHRDIKGKNILVDQNGCLKLADFGSAKAFHSKTDRDNKAGASAYNYTPLWTAPEVLLGEYDVKVDIWSLGCVIIEMTSAKPPWSEQNFENPFRALYHIGNSGAIPKLPDTLSANARDFTLLCLERDPVKRASASDLLKHKWLETIKVELTETGKK